MADSKDITIKMTSQNLLTQLYSPDHLFLSWKYLNKTNPKSFGLSGESIEQFKSSLDINIENLSNQLQLGQFKFSSTRPYLIKKDNGKFRPLQIPEVRDRVVLKGIALILERELKSLLIPGEGVSFAYQKGLGIHQALFKVKEYYDKGDHYIYEADIIDFFGTVNRNDIINKICNALPDQSLNDLIKNGITPKVAGLDQIPNDQRHLFDDKGGIPQGNALSPLFSNICLSPFDERMKSSGYHLIRYADDFVVMSPSIEAAKSAYEESRDYLKNSFGLEVHELSTEENSKTRIIDPRKNVFSFLSVSFDGKHLFPSVKNKEEFLNNVLSMCSLIQNANVLSLLTKVKNSHDGWISTYIFTDVKRYFEEIDWIINAGVYKYLRLCGWKFQKKSLGKLPKQYRRRGDKLFESGECLSSEQRRNSGIFFSKEIYKLRKGQSD